MRQMRYANDSSVLGDGWRCPLLAGDQWCESRRGDDARTPRWLGLDGYYTLFTFEER